MSEKKKEGLRPVHSSIGAPYGKKRDDKTIIAKGNLQATDSSLSGDANVQSKQ